MKTYFIIALFLLNYLNVQAQDEAQWLRNPCISPDGSTIVFSYHGNLYRVSSNGGDAVAITTGDAYDGYPIYSHDGKTIAFASDRYGNFDVFTIPAEGGLSTRLTFNSANDFPNDFTVDDQEVLFGSGREAPAASVRFPSPRLFLNLYKIPVTGGRPILVSAAGAESARYNNNGTKIVFQDRKGYEDDLRKHHVSSVTRDIWIFDVNKNTYTQITNFVGEDREPVFNNNASSIYYLNEKNGTQNLYKMDLSSKKDVLLTNFEDFPVRHLSISKNNTMAFTWKGSIYTFSEGSEPRKISIRVKDDSAYETIKNVDINDVSEFKVSPNGKEIAFVNRGEVFVTGVDDSRTKRITNTPEQERMVNWSPDGKTLLFSGERNNSWNIYKVTLTRPEETYFFASTTLKTEPLIATSAEEYQPKYAPDGKKVAYVKDRNILQVLDIETKKEVTILPEGHNYSYSDGDWDFEWSPDSKWLFVSDQKGFGFTRNTALLKADGTGDFIYPVNSGFGENEPHWALDGKMMVYASSRDGEKSLAYNGSSESDIYAVFLDQKAFDTYILSKEEYELFKEKEKETKKDSEEKEDDKKKDKKNAKDKKVEDLKINLENLDYRKIKLTINSSNISGYVLNKDASKLYYLSEFEKGYDVWVTEPRTKETKILAKLGGSPSGIQISEDNKTLFLSNNGQIIKLDADTGKTTNIKIDGDMLLDAAGERQYIFDHAWLQLKKKFYDPNIHGIDWQMYHDEYAKFLPYINNNYDFQQLLSELLGELNASHTGGRYTHRAKNADVTASLGLLFDENYTGDGIKISEVLSGGPLDNAESKIKKGAVILKINGEEIKADDNWNKYLNNINGKNILLTVKNGTTIFDEKVQPVSMRMQSELMYKRWVKLMEHKVDSLSNGKLGYVHVRGMNDGSFREVFDNVMGKNRDKKALVVDTRFNGGGWLHDDLNTFLSGNLYLKLAPQGNLLKGGESLTRWTKPSIVIMSESNYSDAFIFPYIYKQNGLGKLVGMPVPGTGTAVWWERQIDPTIVFGIPMIATIGAEGRPTENLQVNPDIEVPLPYNDFLSGKDPQLQTAVKELLSDIKE
ncbi:S41 family peptidase [Siansivirga zeaxanthinifaciens]|uniref:Tricorn protease homolog n=1 Tax=Siansivirga zeaxanthinifaciens CC-SAMT-1 TaxID=1454006 RepID=A0A0C5WKT8_9FLAO|nr:S41 family peptidase [Siansivirga zeaxanthinifaciens]AJR03430.1 peptidase S41 [Siansivirga zeaxanthinifaciens CC-SAMT-1]